MKESDLYLPVKRFLEARGYAVKAEVKGCDVVARLPDPDTPPLVVELKTAFSLELVLQGISRQRLSDDVYLAVPTPDTPAKRRNWRGRRRALLRLCRRLELGLMLVDPVAADATRAVEIVVDPGPYKPRRDRKAHHRLATEFAARVGDPNLGGITRRTIVTAYRQDAIRCAAALASGPLAVKAIRAGARVERAADILQKNHYGWFERIARGTYRLTEAGEASLRAHSEQVEQLKAAEDTAA
ncbi:DUF2161 family putative PD-(D/E)XK-type phosphodiesterase [Thalassobaculum sp. OXR-137]|uniref:DUF2161 family putative PD-(D/E)XK-type phosphodiesterase n=1 Tax=Thalassobaculum sp. OXR-137 TaxID=3100173 RepID=UPI002AC9256C|nr:DUF2161 family putative PD-(D/E)XK-type phosphodiesterase [Thalassobaculum sp. OXR-137]WPZ33304.1 DUF2161 family putative PD-(D/E)XK-type phosphodiesterase [Thalassobaculum sp. OXR-137]